MWRRAEHGEVSGSEYRRGRGASGMHGCGREAIRDTAASLDKETCPADAEGEGRQTLSAKVAEGRQRTQAIVEALHAFSFRSCTVSIESNCGWYRTFIHDI